MLPLFKLLSRFKNLTNTERRKKEAVYEVLKENQIPAEIKQISFSKNTIFLNASPIVKTELFLKKEEILKKLRTIPRLEHVTEIR